MSLNLCNSRVTGSRTRAQLRKYFGLLLLLTTAQAIAAQKVTLGKRLDDGAGALAQGYLKMLEADPLNESKRAAMEPFVNGFFGFKALRMVNLGVGTIEAAHLNICSTMLGFYDPEVVPTLKGITARAKSPVEWPVPPETERKTVQRFVVVKQFDRFGSMNDILNETIPEVDPRSQWQWEVGMSLGEIAADLTMWYKFPNYPPFDKSMGEYLASLDKKLNEAPAGTPSSFTLSARRLTALKSKPTYTIAQRDQIAAELGKTLLAALAFSTAGKGFPKRSLVAGSTAGPQRQSTAAVPRPSPPPVTRSTPSPVVRPTPAVRPTPPLSAGSAGPVISPTVRAATLLEDGKKLAAAGSHTLAMAKFNEAARLDPRNGSVFFNRGLSNYSLKLLDKAIEDMTAAIRLRASLPLAYFNRGTFYLDKKAYSQAKADLDQSVALDQTHYRSFYNRGLANFNLTAYDPAYADFTKAINLNRKHSNAYIMRARVLCKKGLLMTAIADQNEAIKLGAKVTKGCNP
ncbi:MAG: hypothetical protein AB7Q37_12675 [Pyrinomonadaceae bacterium]